MADRVPGAIGSFDFAVSSPSGKANLATFATAVAGGSAAVTLFGISITENNSQNSPAQDIVPIFSRLIRNALQCVAVEILDLG